MTHRRILVSCIAALIVLWSATPLVWPLSSVFVYMALPLLVAGLWLRGSAIVVIPPGAPGQNLNSSLDLDPYTSLYVLGLGVSIALSVLFWFWNRRRTSAAVLVSYFAFLVLLMSMSMANFASGDMLLNRKAQALVDLVLVVLGLIVVAHVLRFRVQSVGGGVLRAVIVFLIALQGIAIPGLWGLIWLLNWQNALTLQQTRDLNPAWLSGIAGVISAVVSILTYRHAERERQTARDQERPRITIA
jgi:hypothetical protein